MAKDKEFEKKYKEEKKKREYIRKARRKERQKYSRPRIGSNRYERMVKEGLIQTCEWGSRRCDLLGCNGDC